MKKPVKVNWNLFDSPLSILEDNTILVINNKINNFFLMDGIFPESRLGQY